MKENSSEGGNAGGGKAAGVRRQLKRRDPFTDPELEEVAVCGSWTEYLIVRIIVLVTLFVVALFGIFWPGQHYSGAQSKGNSGANIRHVQMHAIYGVEGLIVLLSAGIIVYRMLCVCKLKTVTIIHVITLIVVLVLAIVCLLPMFSFYKAGPPKTYIQFHTGHSILGFFAIIAFVIQMFLSVLMIKKTMRDCFRRIHSIGGGMVLIMCCMVALSGYEGRRLEYLMFEKRSSKQIFPLILNLLQLCIVVLVASVIVLINTPQFKAFSAMLIRDYDY